MAASSPVTDLSIIDVDAHITEPPDLWTSRAPASLKDRVPRVVGNGSERVWIVDQDVKISTSARVAELNDIFNTGSADKPYNLNGVPASIPHRFDGQELRRSGASSTAHPPTRPSSGPRGNGSSGASIRY